MSLALESPAIQKAVSALKFRADAFIDGRFVPAKSRQDVSHGKPGHRQGDYASRRLRQGRRRRRGPLRPQGVRERGLVADVAA